MGTAPGATAAPRLSPEELGALDHFHTGGFSASLELLELAQVRAEDRVLDIGAGLAGSARLLASTRGCHVDCIEMSSDYCAGAVLLNRLIGLDGRIETHEGSALDLPFPDGSFDVVWMQNVGMNIADKPRLYPEIYRVLKPGGRFAFQEMAAGEAATSYFPLPWATDPADSFLVSAEETRSMLVAAGFVEKTFEDVSDAHLRTTSVEAPPKYLTLVRVVMPDRGWVYPVWHWNEIEPHLTLKNYGYGERYIFSPKRLHAASSPCVTEAGR